jgi:hypothetical protein
MQYRAHFFSRLSDTLRPLHSVNVEGETPEEARAAALSILPRIRGAIGFRICDGTDRQVDIYAPHGLILPES